MKLYILVGDMFLIKNKFGGQSVHFWSCDVTNMEFIRLTISQRFSKDRDFCFGQNNSLKLCTEHFTILGLIKPISGHMTRTSQFQGSSFPALAIL